MIKNDKQLTISREKLAELREELEELEALEANDWTNLQKASIEGMIFEIESDINDYTSLKSGNPDEGINFDRLPEALIKQRIRKGLTQKDVAASLGIAEQQIQRYESTEYAHASLDRVREIASTLGISNKFFSPNEELPTFRAVVSSVQSVGIDEHFLCSRVLSPKLCDIKEQSDLDEPSIWAAYAAKEIQDVFMIDASALSGTRESALIPSMFKTTRRTNLSELASYISYARFVSAQVATASPHTERTPIPREARTVCDELGEMGGPSLENILHYAWEHGVSVVPLADRGGFHGMWSRVLSRDVVVLKQKTRSMTRWAFDLLHELRHAAQARDDDSDTEFIDLTPLGEEGSSGDEAESDANSFATDVLLNCEADEIYAECVARSNNRVRQLKRVVQDVAKERDVPVGALANHVAFKVSSDRNWNWWGAAQNLQEQGHPHELTANALLERLDLTSLSAHGRSVVERAISPPD